jgi:trigger factor
LKIDTEFLDNHQVKVQVEIEAAPFEEAKQRAARRIAKKTKIPGFRPGKAPYAIIVRHLGEPTIIEEAMEILVDELYPKVLEEAKISPYGPGSLENLSVDPPKLDFIIPLSPTVELGDYRSVRIPYDYPGISDEELAVSISELRERQVVLEPVDRPAQEGDQVYIRLSGIRLNAKEDQDSTLIKERDASIIIKAEDSDETEFPFTGFSRTLIGLSVDDEKTINYTYPENDRYTELIGVQAEFQVKVKEIKSRTLPDLNDEFAQSIGEFTTLDDLKTAVKTSLDEQAKEAFHRDYDDKILNEIVSISTIKYPPQMVEREIDRNIDNLKNRLSQQRMDIDLYLKTRNLDMAGLREEVKPVAETGLKKSLVLMEITDVEKINVEPDELRAETSRTMDALQQYLPEREAKKIVSDQESVSNLVGNIMFDMMTKRTLDKIRSIASGKEELSISEEIQPTEPTSESTEAVASIEPVAAAKPKKSKSKKKVEEK